MKLNKHKLLKILFVFIFMFFICYETINYLYKNNKMSSEDYINLLLSDAYENDFYSKTVDIFSKNFDPLNVIELPTINSNNLKSSNNKPIIYLVNSNQELYYKSEFNYKPDVLLSTYLLSLELNKVGISTIYEETNLKEFSRLNDISEPLDLLIGEKQDNNPTIKYIIDIGIEDKRINNNDEAYIYLYINEDNFSFMNSLNNYINDISPISKLYYKKSIYNMISIGNTNNSMNEVMKSIRILSKALKEVMNY